MDLPTYPVRTLKELDQYNRSRRQTENLRTKALEILKQLVGSTVAVQGWPRRIIVATSIDEVEGIRTSRAPYARPIGCEPKDAPRPITIPRAVLHAVMQNELITMLPESKRDSEIFQVGAIVGYVFPFNGTKIVPVDAR